MRLRRWALSLAAGATAIAFSACGGGEDEPDASATPPAPGTVLLKFDTFSPSKLTIAPGDTVTWKWDSKVTHNIKGDGGIDKENADSGTYELTFDEQGTFEYVCTIHPGMKGEITVE